MAYRFEIPESKALAPDVDTVRSSVCEYFSVAPEVLLISIRGTGDIARDIAKYLIRC